MFVSVGKTVGTGQAFFNEIDIPVNNSSSDNQMLCREKVFPEMLPEQVDGFIRNGIMAFDAFSDVAYFRIIVHVFPYMIGYAVTGMNGLPGLSGRQCQSNTLNS